MCRRQGCEHVEATKDDRIRRCPIHDHKLWPKAVVRKIRFHDLRHRTASLLIMRGADLAAVQRILRHADPKTTTEIYGHLAPCYLQVAANRLSFNVPTDGGGTENGAREETKSTEFLPFPTRFLPGSETADEFESGDVKNINENQGFTLERAMGIEPTTLSLGS